MQILILYAALLGWIPVTLLLFTSASPRVAVVISVVAGWLLLPPANIPLPGLPDYGKQTAVVLGILLGTCLFQPTRLLGFRPRWFDLPMMVWCVCPLASSLANGLGLYDGLSSMLAFNFSWGLPYLIGRLYFGDPDGMRLLAIGVACGGFALILPCLFEMRASSVLMPTVYGLGGFEGARLGGWRPRVFFSTGLELGMWMTAASLSGTWLWKVGILKRIGPFAAGSLLIALLITSLLCRTVGATTLLIVGLAVLWISAQYRTRLILAAVLATAPVYYMLRVPQLWSGKNLVDFIERNLSQERGESLGIRFDQENQLVGKALQQPIWGWGGWGRARIYDRYGRDISLTDGMWVIYLGTYGYVGLVSWTTMMILPSWIFLSRHPASRWAQADAAPMAIFAVLLGVYSIDCLANAFMNLSYVMALGGLAAASTAAPSASKARRAGPHASLYDRSLDGPPPPSDIRVDVPGPAPGDPRQLLADRYRSLARTMKSREADRGAAEGALGHAYSILSQIASSRPDDHEAQRQHSDCANELAWLLVDDLAPPQRDPARALELARLATRGDANRADYWTTLGAACCRAGDPAAAIAALERSIELRGGAGTPHDYAFLALAHAQLGDVEAARVLRDRAGLEAAGGDLMAFIDTQINSLSS